MVKGFRCITLHEEVVNLVEKKIAAENKLRPAWERKLSLAAFIERAIGNELTVR